MSEDLFRDFLSLEKKTPYYERPILYWHMKNIILEAEVIDGIDDTLSHRMNKIPPTRRQEQLKKIGDYIAEQEETQINIFQIDC